MPSRVPLPPPSSAIPAVHGGVPGSRASCVPAPPPLEVPLIVVGPRGPDLVLVRSPDPVTWGAVADQVALTAGLPTGSAVYRGPAQLLGDELVGSPPLMAGTVLSTLPALPSTSGDGLVLDCIAGPDAGGSVELTADRPIVVGRSPGCDLVIDDPAVSQRHLRITGTAAGALRVRDLGSTNGTTRLGAAEPTTLPMGTEAPLAIGEPLLIGGSVLRVELASMPSLLREPDGRGRWQLTLAARDSPIGTELTVPEHPGPRPVRTTRLTPWAAAVLGASAGVVISILTGMWLFLLMALLGPLTMAATAIGDRLGDRRSHRQQLRVWHRAVQEYRRRCRDIVHRDLLASWREFADPARRLRWAVTCSRELWREDLDDGLRVTLGVGTRATEPSAGAVPSAVADPSAGPGEPASGAPPLRTGPVPLEIVLPSRGVIGVCGGGRGSIRWLLAQLLTSVPPDQLPLQVYSASADLWCLDGVPQLRTANGTVGGVFRRPDHAPLTQAGPARSECTVIIDDHERWHRDPRVEEALTRCHGLVLVTAGSRARLPRACTRVIDLDGLPGTAIGMSADRLRQLARALLPLTVRGSADEARPGPLRVPPDEVLHRRWAGRGSPVVALGRSGSRTAGHGPADGRTPGDGNGSAVELDLAADGPHLLIAGTTGSGKSELLQTLVSGLIAAAPPEQLSLLLIDYKGGAAFAALARAPHVAGLVTDLDPALGGRALRSLRAEIRRREQYVAHHGITDLTDPTRHGRVLPDAPPRLVIVVDEFATLAAELPAFVPGLLDVAQRGRSLGLHLVLATQRPAGAVTPAIRANIGTRICLRVTDPAESTDLIGTPDAAGIRADCPGEAFLQRAGQAPERLQIAGVSAPEQRTPTVRRLGEPVPPATGPSPLSQLVAAACRVATLRGIPPPAPPWRPAPGAVVLHDDPSVLGLLDRPDQQLVQDWRLPDGSLLITGPARSGRSAALLRWSAAIRAAGGQVVVVDAAGDLGRLTERTGVSTLLGLDAPELVLRLLSRLTAAARHRPAASAPVGLVIDGYEALADALDALDPTAWSQQLLELIARGPSAGIRCAVSGDVRTAHARPAAAFEHHVQLGLPDASSAPTPGAPPGRAFVTELPDSELQWAVPGPWPARPPVDDPIVVRTLPERVLLEELDQPPPGTIALGVGGDEGDGVYWDPAGSAGLVVAGAAGGGTSAALRTIARGAASQHLPTLWIGRGAPPGRPGTAEHPRQGDPAARTLENPSAAELTDLLARHEGDLLLIADDAHRFEHEDLGAVLLRFLEHAVPGQVLVLGTRLERLAAFRGPVAELARAGTGVLLGADAADGVPLGLRLPRRPPGRRIRGRGHFVSRGRSTALQVALSDPP